MRKKEYKGKKIDYVRPTLELFNNKDYGWGMGCGAGSYAVGCDMSGASAGTCASSGASAAGACGTGYSAGSYCSPSGPSGAA